MRTVSINKHLKLRIMRGRAVEGLAVRDSDTSPLSSYNEAMPLLSAAHHQCKYEPREHSCEVVVSTLHQRSCGIIKWMRCPGATAHRTGATVTSLPLQVLSCPAIVVLLFLHLCNAIANENSLTVASLHSLSSSTPDDVPTIYPNALGNLCPGGILCPDA